jgi:protease I
MPKDTMTKDETMAGPLDGLRVAVLMANEGVEEVELTEPVKALRRAGADVHLVAPQDGEVQAFHHLDKGDAFPVDEPLDQVSVEDFDALVLPGGVANPDQLRTVPEAVAFAGGFVEQGKPVASICHGPWTLVEAGVLHDRTITSWPSLRTDVRNAGGRWIDQDVVVDANGPGAIVTSRKPDDLPRFCEEMVSAFARAAV